MLSFDYYSLFLLGLMGTGHCIGMCGPLVLAIPAQTGTLKAHFAYHLGRITTYAIIGSLMGTLGLGLSWLFRGNHNSVITSLLNTQIGLSLLAAFFLIYFGLTRIGFFREPAWMSISSPEKIPGFSKILSAISTGHNSIMYATGLLMGFLPCGLSFAGFTRALPSGGPVQGGLFLFCFGIGTLPGLLLLGTSAAPFFRKYRQQSDLLSGILMIGMALSLASNAILTLNN